MGALSKEIEKIDELIEEAEQRNYVVGSIWPDRRKQLVHLKETYPHLDHPAAFLVEEMEKLLAKLSEAPDKYKDGEYGGLLAQHPLWVLMREAKAILRKVKEAE